MKRTPLRRKSPLRAKTSLVSGGRLPPKRTKPRRGPPRDPAYLAWVRCLPCAAPEPGGCPSTLIHAHHMGRARGLGQKSDDRTCVPLCYRHHQEWHDANGLFSGWDQERRRSWGDALIAATQARWYEQLAAAGWDH